MKKIVIDARESGTTTGRYIDKMIEYLHKLKPQYEITVLTKKHRVEFLKSIAPNFKVIETPYQEFTLGEQWGFKKQLESLHPDLVHFTMVQQPVLYRGRVVTSMLDLTTLRFINPSKNGLVYRFKQRVYKYVNRVAARKSKAIICISQFVKDDIIKFFHVPASKITVTHNAADKIAQPAEKVKALDGKQFIMYVGRPLPHKNLPRLVEAFEILQTTNPNLHLVLAGKKDTLYEQMENNVRQKGIKNVIFTGFISEGELRWLYEHTAAYVFPSLSEGFGLPGLEAMIHGAPVVSSNATSLPEIYGDAAEYFDPLKVRAMAQAIDSVIKNKKLAEKLIARGKIQASKFSWKRLAEQTLDVYASSLSN